MLSLPGWAWWPVSLSPTSHQGLGARQIRLILTRPLSAGFTLIHMFEPVSGGSPALLMYGTVMVAPLSTGSESSCQKEPLKIISHMSSSAPIRPNAVESPCGSFAY